MTGIKNELTTEIYFNLLETGHRFSETILWFSSRVRKRPQEGKWIVMYVVLYRTTRAASP
jgi:hypothetical protein